MFHDTYNKRLEMISDVRREVNLEYQIEFYIYSLSHQELNYL